MSNILRKVDMSRTGQKPCCLLNKVYVPCHFAMKIGGLFDNYFCSIYSLQATLSAMIGDRELSTIVSTSDLSITTGKVAL